MDRTASIICPKNLSNRSIILLPDPEASSVKGMAQGVWFGKHAVATAYRSPRTVN